MPENVRVLVIAGSVRTPSYTRVLCAAVRDELVARGSTVDWWDVADRPLPVADPAFHRNPQDHADAEVRRLVVIADAADAIVLSSPLYHNSFSGVLKNLLDNLHMRQFQHKPVGVAGSWPQPQHPGCRPAADGGARPARCHHHDTTVHNGLRLRVQFGR